MTDFDYKKSIDNVIYLCSCVVNGIKPVNCTALELDHLYQAAHKHMLTSIVGQALRSIGISTSDFKTAIAAAQRKTIVLNNDFLSVVTALEGEGIWYMPLKGVVLKNLYPSFAMREMADIDILIDRERAEDTRKIMIRLGFQVKKYGDSNDDSYLKKPVSYFEMHTDLLDARRDPNLFEYYKNVKDRLLKDKDNAFGYHFSPEDFYIFMIAHEYKHYNMGGTGLRSLLDTYVYLRSTSLDMLYIANECQKLGISDYEMRNRSLAQKLFAGEALTAEEQQMLDYIVSSGTYGTTQHYIENKVVKDGGKIQYLIQRIFGPIKKNDPFRESFRKKYSTFYNNPILLPLLPFYRFFRAVRSSPNRIKAEMNALRKTRSTDYLE